MTVRTNTSTTRSATSRRRLARSACALVAASLAAAGSFWLGGAPTAQADPGDTFVPIGSSQLVQSEDLAAIQVSLDTERVVLNRDTDFSSCLGEGNAWTTVLRGSPKPITSLWTRQGRDDRSVSESIAQAKDPAQAQRFATTLVNSAIRACRTPKFDFHYGPIQSSSVGSGYATWALSYSGNERHADGGVVVIRKGTNVGFLQVNGTWGPADQTLESVAKVAVDRLLD
ncbi:MAG: hypothetical protein ABWX96_01970 [Propionibacteriaceae bacterium]